MQPPKRPANILTGQSVVRGEPAGRYAVGQPDAPADRNAPIQQSGYSYSMQEGFRTVDGPLGTPYPETLAAGLLRSGYDPVPALTVGEGPVRMEAYARGTSAEFLLVVFTNGLEQLVVCKSFPNLMELLAKWASAVEAAGRAAPSQEGQRRSEPAPPPAKTYRFRNLQGRHLSGPFPLEALLSVTPSEDGLEIVDSDSLDGPALKVFNRAAGGWADPPDPRRHAEPVHKERVS